MKTIILILCLATLTFGQRNLLLLYGDSPIVYDGTELITAEMDRTLEPTSIYASNFNANADGFVSAISMNVVGQIVWNSPILPNAVSRLNPTATSVNSRVKRANTFVNGGRIALSFNYYIPSGNTAKSMNIYAGNIEQLLTNIITTDAWTFNKTNFTNTTTSVQTEIQIRVGATTATTDSFYFHTIQTALIPNYTTAGNHSYDTSSTYKQEGTYSGKIVATDVGNGTTNTISLASAKFTTVTSGTNYRFQLYAYTSTASTTLTFKLGDIVLTNIVPTTGMSLLTFDFKATASTTGNILLYLDKAATVYLDEVSLKSGS